MGKRSHAVTSTEKRVTTTRITVPTRWAKVNWRAVFTRARGVKVNRDSRGHIHRNIPVGMIRATV